MFRPIARRSGNHTVRHVCVRYEPFTRNYHLVGYLLSSVSEVRTYGKRNEIHFSMNLNILSVTTTSGYHLFLRKMKRYHDKYI